jgi:hypothetical protein
MRRLGLVSVAVLLAGALVAQVSAASSGFSGSWTSIDPVDGRTQHLTIMGSAGRVQMAYVDEFGTTCLDVGAPTNVFSGVLTGTISGNELVGWWKAAGCGSRLILRASDHFEWIFEYDPGTDTLFGAINDGPATWYRD